jgi:hypothetical protein
MAKRKAKAKITSTWSTRRRSVGGRRRTVWVRKKAGRYQVRLTDPSKKKKSTKRKTTRRKTHKKRRR